MASRSSPTTHSRNTTMTNPSERSRNEVPRQGGEANPQGTHVSRDPKDKKHKSLEEIQESGRQSAQGDRPKR